jgi:hypothetical protein
MACAHPSPTDLPLEIYRRCRNVPSLQTTQRAPSHRSADPVAIPVDSWSEPAPETLLPRMAFYVLLRPFKAVSPGGGAFVQSCRTWDPSRNNSTIYEVRTPSEPARGQRCPFLSRENEDKGDSQKCCFPPHEALHPCPLAKASHLPC